MGFHEMVSSWSSLGMRTIEKLAGGPAVAVEAPGQESVRKVERKDGSVTYAVACCSLALPPTTGCWGACDDRAGYTMRSWGCCHNGSTFYSCMECTTGGNCYSGSFYCSYAQHVPGGCA